MVTPPYYAVIFKSKRSEGDFGYTQAAKAMIEEAKKQEGFLGSDSVRGADGVGITVSYWASLECIDQMRQNASHKAAKRLGKLQWYDEYSIRICKVESEGFFER